MISCSQYLFIIYCNFLPIYLINQTLVLLTRHVDPRLVPRGCQLAGKGAYFLFVLLQPGKG